MISDQYIPLSSHEIPVEIILIFIVNNREEFTVVDIIHLVEHRYKIELTYNRVKQILNSFVQRGRLSKEVKTGKKNKQTTFYTFQKLM